jgi:hypothetical protein
MTERPNSTDNLDDAADSQPEDPLTAFFGAPISVYTRQQAIDDGVLVDVSDWAGPGPNGMMGGFRVPVVFTRALFELVDLDNAPDEPWARLARRRGESTRGRAHDVLWMAALWARRSAELDRFGFVVLITKANARARSVQSRITLEARIDGDGVVIGFPEDF